MPTLAVVATPIGNLEDITLRALRILRQADLILCEDTRVTSKLLSHYQIATPTQSFHQHSDEKKIIWVMEQISLGRKLALVTDAGTPGVADPGNNLVARFVKKFGSDLLIEPIPGPTALTTALSVCCFATDQFLFLGFLSHKKGRQTELKIIAQTKTAVVVYESVHRLAKLLSELGAIIPNRPLAVMKELTKQFETIWRGTAGELLKKIPSTKIKGEFVIVIAPMGHR